MANPDTRHRCNPSELVFLMLIVCVAFALRWIGFTNAPFAGDEGFTLSWSRDWVEFFRTWDTSHINYLRYPLYFGMTAPILAVVTDQVMAIRVVAFAAGILSIPIAYLLLRTRFGFTVAIGCAIVIALNPYHVGMSAFARYYSLLFLLGSTSMLMLLRAVEQRSITRLIAAAAVFILAVLAHPSALLLAPAMIAFLVYLGARVLIRDRTIRNLRWDLFSKVVAFSILILVTAGGAFSAMILSMWAPTGATHLTYSAPSLLVGYAIRFGIPLCVTCCIAAIYFVRANDVAGTFFAIWAALPPALLGVLALLQIGTSPHYLFVAALGPICLSVYYVASASARQDRLASRGTWLFAAVVLAVALGPAVQLASYYRDYDSHDYRAVMNSITKKQVESGSVVIATSVGYPAYYADQMGQSVVKLPRSTGIDDVIDASQDEQVVVLSSAWLFTLNDDELERFQSELKRPCWFIAPTRNGLDPNLPSTTPVFKERRDRDNPEDYLITFEIDPQERIARFFTLVSRIGDSRFDHRHNELFVYRLRSTTERQPG